MSTLKKSLSLVLALLMLISVFTVAPLTAGAAETHKRHTKADIEKKTTGSGDYYYYLTNDGAAEIRRYYGSDADLVIPDTIDGYKVVGIYSEAFKNHEEIKNIQIPDSVTYIGYEAFKGTGYYKNEANWENGALYIGKFLIEANNQRVTYTIKDGTTIIADYALQKRFSDDPVFAKIDYSLLEEIVIPSSVTHIGSHAFDYCTKLKKVTLSDGLQYIGESAFNECHALESINIPDGLQHIGKNAFEKSALKSINIPDSVTTLDAYIFKDCTCLKNVTLPNGLNSLGDYVFEGCTSLENVTLPNGLKYIGNDAFSYCKSLKNITIPDSVTEIDESAFKRCYSLENVTLPSGISTISYGLFYNCSSLNSINIPSSVTSIGEDAFYDTGIYNNEANWENGALYYGKYLIDTNPDVVKGSFTIKAGTELIACFALQNCNISSIKIPDSVKYINSFAFYECRNLKSVTIGKNVKEIGYRAFSNTALKSVTIPANVIYIAQYAFGYNTHEIIEEEFSEYIDNEVPGFTINGYAGTAAENYAKNNEFKFVTIKKANTLKVSAKTKAVKAKKLKKKKQTVKPLKIKNAKGAVTVTKVKKGSTAKIFKKIKVNKKTGAITIKKGKYAKKTYKIKLKITAKGNSDYNSKTLTKVVKIKVK